MLAAGSAYFKGRLQHTSMQGDAGGPLTLEATPAPAFEAALTFLYEGATTFAEALLPEVLRLAAYLGIEPLQEASAQAVGSEVLGEHADD